MEEGVAEGGGPAKGTLLAQRRLQARVALERAAKRMRQVLEDQRSHTEDMDPSTKVEELDFVDEDLEEELNEAYDTLNTRGEELKTAVAAVRDLERRLRPSELIVPAVMTFAMSAPSTSWALDVVSLTSLPRLAAMMTSIFTAAFSNPPRGANDNGDNRLKRCWAADKKNKKKKKRKTAAEVSRAGDSGCSASLSVASGLRSDQG